MSQHAVVIAFDLGTSATTASHCLVRDSFDANGKLHREKRGRGVTDVKDWPGGNSGSAIGNVCLPTDLVYAKSQRQLLFWGFEAQQFLDDPSPGISLDDIFVVEHIKLLLPDPDQAKIPSVASTRYRAMREDLILNLGKQPYDVFEDFLNEVVDHVMQNVMQTYIRRMNDLKIEMVLAFPSGWEDHIHTTVAMIGARAMKRAIMANAHALKDIVFGMENVYTVSETLCGVKEWLRDAVADGSTDLEPQSVHLDELNEGDLFLPVDIGGGTGCLTPLMLVSKSPLGVEQLDRTRSLEVSGEAVQAEFERWLRPRITKRDYPEDIPRLIKGICRLFKEEKKNCGLPSRMGFLTWNFRVPRLRSNPRMGFEKDCMKIERKFLERCFDPVIAVLVEAIEETLRKFPSIKVIVFLGQFGGSSVHLQKQMAVHPLSRQVRICHSGTGKLDVVKGALSERLSLDDTFVQKFQTLKSYGTLISLLYTSEVEKAFPNPTKQDAVPFEWTPDGPRLKVIEWAIPKGTPLADGLTCNVDRNDRRFHTWLFSESAIEFEDIIIISDEAVPRPQEEKSYTLWTKSHERNDLFIDGQRIQVQQIPFSWDLGMSQKIDSQGNIVGPYTRDDLRTFMHPEQKLKDHRRRKLRDLHYELIWHITEMQAKVYVQAVFPNQTAPSIRQLAKERVFGEDEKPVSGESRSKDLEKDIEIEKGVNLAAEEERGGGEAALEDERDEELDDICGAAGLQLIEELATEHEAQFGTESAGPSAFENQHRSQTGHRSTESLEAVRLESQQASRQRQQSRPSQELLGVAAQALAVTSPNAVRIDGRSHDGCYTCMYRNYQCDGQYVLDSSSGSLKCNYCLRHRTSCYPATAAPNNNGKGKDAAQQQLLERKRLARVLGKRKAREESCSSSSEGGSSSSERSTTAMPTEQLVTPLTMYQSMEGGMDGGDVARSSRPLQRGTHMAIRGGKRASKIQRR